MSLRVALILASSEDPAEMQQYAAFHLAIHCLPKYPFWGFQTASMENPPIHGRADVWYNI